MERKRASSGLPVASAVDAQSFTRQTGPQNGLVASTQVSANEQNALPPPPHAPQSFGFPAPVNTNASAATRGWRPGRVGGRHDSPLYGKYRKRPSSSSIDSNVSWSGSEIESVGGLSTAHSEHEKVSRLSWVSSVAAREEATCTDQQDLAPAAALFEEPAVNQMQAAVGRKLTGGSEGGVDRQLSKMPLGKPMLDCENSRVDLIANSSENVFATTSPSVYDEEKNGPQSCPSMFTNTRQPQFSIDKLHQLRSNELITSKLLPTRTSVDSLMGYVRELQLSEATLRKQLVKNKQHTEEKLTHSLSKVNELERTVQEVERDREIARRKLEEQEQLIRDLAAKLKQAEAAKSKGNAVPTIKELLPIAEEACTQTEIETSTVTVETNALDVSPPVPTPAMQQQPSSTSTMYPDQLKDNNSATQFQFASPRSPDRPLWNAWASGDANPMENPPPVFTIGSTGSDPAVSSSTLAAPTLTTDSKATTVGEFELKSVLLSLRNTQDRTEASGNINNAQHVEQNDLTESFGLQQEYTQQEPAAALNMGASPSSRYSHQQGFTSSGKTSAVHDAQSMYPLTKSSSQSVPMASSANENPSEHKHSGRVVDDNMINAIATETNEFQGQPKGWPSATPTPSFVTAEEASIKEMVPPTWSSSAESTTVLPPSQVSPKRAQFQYDGSKIATGSSEGTQVTQPEHESCFIAEDAVAGIPSVPLPGSPPLAPPTSEIPTLSAASAQIESMAGPTEPVSLETLLVDFFTEVDNKRLKMAKVYGKRYAGREKWLFAELTKRYDAAKVAALKARFENGSGDDASTVINRGRDTSDHHATNSFDVSTHSKTGRQAHPRHPQFVHPPTPDVDLSAGAGVPSVSSPIGPPQNKDESRFQTRQVAEEGNIFSSPSEIIAADPILTQKRRSEGNISSLSGPPLSFPNLKKTGEEDHASTVRTDGPTSTNEPAQMVRYGEPTGHDQLNHLPSRSQTGMENSNAAPSGLRQRHQLSAHSQPNADAERPAVTLEGLLKELYKTHQPDKLKNVSIVAKQYAGRERELVVLLKGKYGALSVKRLEENLDVLERAYRDRMCDKIAGKKRGCFVRTISLVFWLSLLLYFSFGAVFVSFVVLDAWECRSFDSEEQELEANGGCLPLKKELETFTYERIAAYMSQSHPDACFCLEWKARQSALFGTFSSEDLVKLARLVPFSPESFGAPWISTLKEQVPSQEFYDTYAKPVVDLSLDAGLFVWSSVLELAGYDEVSGKSPAGESALNDYSGKVSSLDKDSASDAPEGLLQQTAEADNERFADSVDADVLVTEEANVAKDEDVAAASGVLEQGPAEVEPDTFAEMLKSDDPATSDAAANVTDNVWVEDEDIVAGSEEMAPANEEGSLSLSETDGEEHATIELINVLELEDVVPIEAAESFDAGEQESANEAEAEELWTEVNSVSAEEIESVDRAEDGVAAFTKPEETHVGAENSSFKDVKEVFGAAVELDEEMSPDVVAASDGIVEVEVHQEGLDLLYHETETDEALNVASVEASRISVDKVSKPLLGVGEETSDTIEETEADEVEGAFEDVLVDAPEEDVSPVMRGIDEDFVAATSSSPEADMEVMSLESDAGIASEVFEIEAENVGNEALQMESTTELSSEFDFVTEDSELLNNIDVEELALGLTGEEIAVSSLSGGPESEVGIEELDHLADAIAQETETMSDEEDGVPSEENDANMQVEEEFVLTKSDPALSFGSSDVDADMSLSEESTISSSDDGHMAIKEESDEDHEESVALAENEESMPDELEENSEEADDEFVVPAKLEVASELGSEEYVGGIPSEDIVTSELTEELENQDFDLKRDVDEVLASSVEIEAAGEGSNLLEVEYYEVTNEMDEVGNTNVDSTTPNGVEAWQSVAEDDLVNELGEGYVGIEAVVGSDEEDTDSVEHTEEVNEHVEDIGFSLTEVDSPITDEAEPIEDGPIGVVDEGTHISDEVEAVALEAASTTHQVDAIGDPEVSHAAGSGVTKLQQPVDKSSALAIEKESNNGLASVMNEVLARLVEPFEAAKTAALVVTTDSEHEVDDF